MSDQTTPAVQHAPEDGCFFCASDNELARAVGGDVRRTLHMGLPASACPHWIEEADRG